MLHDPEDQHRAVLRRPRDIRQREGLPHSSPRLRSSCPRSLSSDAYGVGLDGFLDLSLEELGVDAGTERIHDLNEPPGALRGDLVGGGVFGPRFLVSEHVPLLVEDSLQVALLAVAEHEAPVGAFITSDRGTGGELDLWYNHTAWLMMSGGRRCRR